MEGFFVYVRVGNNQEKERAGELSHLYWDERREREERGTKEDEGGVRWARGRGKGSSWCCGRHLSMWRIFSWLVSRTAAELIQNRTDGFPIGNDRLE
jgi:hypothetical protein